MLLLKKNKLFFAVTAKIKTSTHLTIFKSNFHADVTANGVIQPSKIDAFALFCVTIDPGTSAILEMACCHFTVGISHSFFHR